jgi:hypothetical protein
MPRVDTQDGLMPLELWLAQLEDPLTLKPGEVSAKVAAVEMAMFRRAQGALRAE